MTMTESKTRDYQKPELTERSKNLQQEALGDKTGVFVIHNIQLKFIEKLDFKTADKKWTDKEKQKINELTDHLSDKLAEFISNELENNNKLGLLETKHNVGDFKALAFLREADSMLRQLLSL